MRVTVSHLKIDTNTHFFAFFSPPQGAREVRPCASTRACPPPHVLPPRLSCTTQPSWAPRHSLCWRWHFLWASEHPVEPLLLLCWQLRFFEFLCDVPGSALYVCCECDHNWVMCVGMKNPTLENECTEKMVFRTERVECRSVGRYDGRLKLSVLHTLCITDYIT